MQVQLGLGQATDYPWASPIARLLVGFNMRLRAVPPAGVSLETVGLTSALQDIAGEELTVPTDPTEPYRTIFPFQIAGEGINWFAGRANLLRRIIADPASTPGTGTRYSESDITPGGLVNVPDTVPNPSLGETAIPPQWQFADDGSFIVGIRSDVAENPHSWERSALTYASLGNAPQNAVGLAIENRILMLLGADSVDPGNVDRWNVFRWSDRLNYDEWTPSDTTLAGENYIENGSRIIGGGNCGRYGIGIWTDQNFTIVTETGDITTVFAKEEIDPKRGLYANRAWTVADGKVWWLDNNKDLVVYDGGQPRVIPNPLKVGFLESVSAVQAPRVYVEASEDFNEVLIWIPQSDTDLAANEALVYNYVNDFWYVWRFVRPSFVRRLGVNPALGIDLAGRVLAHDIDIGLAPGIIPSLNAAMAIISPAAVPSANNVEPFDWSWSTNLITRENPASMTHAATRVLLSTLHTPALGAETDTFDGKLVAYEDVQATDDSQESTEVWEQGDSRKDYRGSGRSYVFVASATGVKTVFRFGMMDIKDQPEGER